MLFVVVLGAGVLGWEPPPSQGQVWVCRSEYHIAKIPYETGMKVKDAVARSHAVLGARAHERVVLYRWRSWLPERVPDATVMGMQGFFYALNMHQCSNDLWRWWDGVVPRQCEWREIARDASAQDLLVESGAMIIVHTGR